MLTSFERKIEFAGGVVVCSEDHTTTAWSSVTFALRSQGIVLINGTDRITHQSYAARLAIMAVCGTMVFSELIVMYVPMINSP